MSIIGKALDERLEKLLTVVAEKFSDTCVEKSYMMMDIPVLVISKDIWFDFALFLRDNAELAFTYLRNLSGVDYETHMEVLYHVYSFTNASEVIVKLKLDMDDLELPSASNVWAAANWNEREIFDLLGIKFNNHPNLKRILMPDDWEGHPLRKDYEQLDRGI